MDIHPPFAPQQPIRSRRDFLIHILTITAGLLIALAVNSTAQYFQHQRLAGQARTTFRAQIENNRKIVGSHLKSTMETTAQLQKAIGVVDTDIVAAKSIVQNAPWEFVDLDTSSWEPAIATGSLTYMKLDEVHKYAQIRTSELTLNRLNDEYRDVWFQLTGYNEQAPELKKGDVTPAKRLLRMAVAYSKRIASREQQLLGMYEEAEK